MAIVQVSPLWEGRSGTRGKQRNYTQLFDVLSDSYEETVNSILDAMAVHPAYPIYTGRAYPTDAENRQTMGADERAEWIETAWFTTTAGGNLTLWLLGPAVTLFVLRKKHAPEPNVAAERQSEPTDAVSDPPPKEVVQSRADTRCETCPHCRMKIMRKADGRCPSCQSMLNGRQ